MNEGEEYMKINVLYSCSDEFAEYAYISINSLFETNKDISDICVYLIEDGMSEEKNSVFKQLAEKYKRDIKIIPFSDIANQIEEKNLFYAKATYSKLFIGKICKEDKIICIDCDTLVTGSLSSMWEINIDNYLVAGIQECLQDYYLQIAGMSVNDRYINGGILILNLKKWREVDLESKFIDYINLHKGIIPNYDQGIINGVCKEKMLIIHPKYNAIPQLFFYKSRKEIEKVCNIKNYYDQKLIDEAINKPTIVHFIHSFFDRPWNEGCTHPYKEMYLSYMGKSPFGNKMKCSKLKKGVKIRKFVYKHIGFQAFLILERSLDLRRRYIIKKKYFKNV